ncbi:hypothetical protein NDU88_001645 [Pleurodeles waltl]|uniref:Uncharacterized protein n=1 Tax=Pleurodeles waltl TaxID=8319 RepID=A0AAV7TKP5_PLEWA|nr:hypothetical protein NDU88_001645 [Pleurodeles waltl]
MAGACRSGARKRKSSGTSPPVPGGTGTPLRHRFPALPEAAAPGPLPGCRASVPVSWEPPLHRDSLAPRGGGV